MSQTNLLQIGGDHYKGTSYQHWDFVVAVSMRYLEGCATKYVVRHRHKNGVQDLEKARHYIDKITELYVAQKYTNARAEFRGSFLFGGGNENEMCIEIKKFTEANRLTTIESEFVYLCTMWANPYELALARTRVQGLIDAWAK